MSAVFKFYNYNADANKCYEELQSIGEEITPQQIVDYARDENTELHKCFTWDDTIAAQNWRKQEARRILQCLVYVDDIKEENEPTKLRVFYKTDNSVGYKPTKFIVQNKSEYEVLLERACAELQIFKQKYSMLSELENIMALID